MSIPSITDGSSTDKRNAFIDLPLNFHLYISGTSPPHSRHSTTHLQCAPDRIRTCDRCRWRNRTFRIEAFATFGYEVRRSLTLIASRQCTRSSASPRFPFLAELEDFETEFVRVRDARIEVPAGPPHQRIIFVVCRISHYFEEVLVSRKATDIFRWAPAGDVD